MNRILGVGRRGPGLRWPAHQVLERQTAVRAFAAAAGGKEKLVILGTGWGSFRVLSDIDASKYDLAVVSPRNHLLFTPMLASSALGTVNQRSICQPVRPVVGVGFQPNDFNTPGVKEHALFMKETADATRFKDHVLEKLEEASYIHGSSGGLAMSPDEKERVKEALTFVVVGGGPTGVELAGELTDFLHS